MSKELPLADRTQRKRSLRAERIWARRISRGHGGTVFGSRGFVAAATGGFSHAHRPQVGMGLSLGPIAGALSLALEELRFVLSHPWVKKAGIGVGVTMVSSLAVAATLATYGYVAYPKTYWNERIMERTQSPILGTDGTLIGSVDTVGKLDPKMEGNRAFIPLEGALPATYKAALLYLENRGFEAGGVHNLCGIDAPVMVWQMLKSFGRAGGSGLSQQLTKNLNDWSSEDPAYKKFFRKFIELGASCQLYKTLGKEQTLRMSASYSPVWQGNGTLRGIEAGARALFDTTPDQLSDALQALLAASAKEPLMLLKDGDVEVPCSKVYPVAGNLDFDLVLAKAHAARKNQCRVIYRAKSAVGAVLSGDARQAALDELVRLERDGITIANPFEPISEKRLVNLSTRTKDALPIGVLAQIKREADDGNYKPGESLTVSFDAVDQHLFNLAMRSALDRVQRSPAGRAALCMPLTKDGDRSFSPQRCAKSDGKASADVLAVKVDAKTGGIKEIYATTPLLMDSVQSLGSVNKWVIMLAAVADGYTAATPVCPRAAWDGQHPLKRETKPEYGFADCNNGRNTISFAQAIARSDNLAFYDVATTLGVEKLAAAAKALGLGKPDTEKHLPYALAFGTFGATPRQLLGATQGLVSVTWGLNTTGTAPRILQNISADQNDSIAAIAKMLPQVAQKETVRALMAAPVSVERGTLGYVRSSDVTAGKTGTVQSAVKSSDGHHYNHSKWAVTYQRATGDINLWMVASPLPSTPLAKHFIDGSTLGIAHRILLNPPTRKD